MKPTLRLVAAALAAALRAMTFLRREARPYFLSIPEYIHELRQIRTASAFHDWVHFKFPFVFPFAPFPLYVTIEPTILCNFRCIHCSRLSALKKRGIGSMAVSMFEKVIREISAAKKPPNVLKMGGAGEPALHPHFHELMSLLDMLRGKPVHTLVYTNGTLFERFSAQDIIRWNIHRIVVSIDGIDAKSYERIRVGGNYRKLTKLVCDFRGFRDRSSGQKPLIEIRHVVMEDETLKELLRFRRHWIPPGDIVKFQSLYVVGEPGGQISVGANRTIRRELSIGWNGNVPLWGSANGYAGNSESQTIEELWLRIRDFLQEHCGGSAHLRQPMPPPQPTRFCVLAKLPLEIVFKRVTYRLAIAQVPVSSMWHLEARWPGGYWLCAYADSEAKLRKTLCETGVELGRATMPRTIFERLVKEGRAEVVG